MLQKPSYRPTVVLNSQGYPLVGTDGRRMGSSVNSGKQGKYTTDSDPPNKDIKNSRKGQIHFLHDYPEGMDNHNLDGAHQVLVNEIMKTTPNDSFVKKEMNTTLALHRK